MDSPLRRLPLYPFDKRATRAALRARWSFIAAQSARVTASIFAMTMLAACAATDSPNDAFFDNLTSLCEGTFTGQVISDQAVDADWIGADLVVGPVSCAEDVIRMPLAVGDDRSRTWVMTRDGGALEFRHEHIEPDGSPSAVTQYGGFARDGGTAIQQAFPADDLTKANFTDNGIAVSNTNVWTFELSEGQLTYTLARPATETDPARDFRAQFDVRS